MGVFLVALVAAAGVHLPAALADSAPVDLPISGCSARKLGCYSDCLGALGKDLNSRTLSVGVSGCCNVDQDPIGGCVECPTACLNAGMKEQCPASGHSCPKCASASLDSTYCADLCAQMGFEHSGVEAGSQCFCGREINSKAVLNAPGKTCDQACAKGGGLTCGGNCAIDVMEIDCGSNWGWVFILMLGVCAGIYVGGGVGYAHKVKGAPLTPAALPHREFWIAGYGLVCDGAMFTFARVQELRGVDPTKESESQPYEPLGDGNDNAKALAGTKRDDSTGSTGVEQTLVAADAAKDSSGSDGDEDLVE